MAAERRSLTLPRGVLNPSRGQSARTRTYRPIESREQPRGQADGQNWKVPGRVTVSAQLPNGRPPRHDVIVDAKRQVVRASLCGMQMFAMPMRRLRHRGRKGRRRASGPRPGGRPGRRTCRSRASGGAWVASAAGILGGTFCIIVAGLDPVIQRETQMARPALDARVKPAHDDLGKKTSEM